ncbi:MAG: hypothetical protein M3N93_08475 [Acidobacteriota bacterium]|nr:hypothetical protein [Acidobacteriota bacterium]
MVRSSRWGSDIGSIDPESGELTPLFNPRLDRWDDHLCIRHGEMSALTAIGRVTIKLLQLNRAARIAERQILPVSIQAVPEEGSGRLIFLN